MQQGMSEVVERSNTTLLRQDMKGDSHCPRVNGYASYITHLPSSHMRTDLSNPYKTEACA